MAANPMVISRENGAATLDALAEQKAAKLVSAAKAPAPVVQQRNEELHASTSTKRPDPVATEALYGIAGEFVRMTEPRTEADPAALLIQFLVAFGALVGRGPHFRVEGDEHHSNLFALLVGNTAKGRKGTSWGRVREVFARILGKEDAPGWKPHVSGLSTGEGIKYHVRNARDGTKTTKNGETVVEVLDEGISDKRLLVVESEFASVLRVVQRQGSTLSATIREAWDSGNLRTLTKNDPVEATGAHIAVIGHITSDELRAELTATDSANGFANRFLFVAVQRSKLLPRGGGAPDEVSLTAFAERLAEIVATARTRDRITMTDDAWKAWDKVYPELSAGGDGLHGAVTARAEAQVIRLALVYCLLDSAEAISPAHLLAALAVWNYCNETARFIFGSSLGDRIADEALRRLRAAGNDGLTRDDLRNAFQRHVPSERIGIALEMLKERGKVACERVSTGGRPSEVWRATN